MKLDSFDRSSLIKCSMGTLFTADAPRLPNVPMLGFDRIDVISAEGGDFGLGFAKATKHIQALDQLLASHFVGDPIMPGSLLVDGLLQLTGFFGAYLGFRGRGRATRIERAEFLHEITPDDESMHFEIEIRRIAHDKQVIISNGLVRSGANDCMIARSLWVAIIEK